MARKINTSVNIIRDSGKDINYIPTQNAINTVKLICNDFKKGLRSFNIIGSYGTGKSSFLWALQTSLKNEKSIFDINILKVLCFVCNLLSLLLSHLSNSKSTNNESQ